MGTNALGGKKNWGGQSAERAENEGCKVWTEDGWNTQILVGNFKGFFLNPKSSREAIEKF